MATTPVASRSCCSELSAASRRQTSRRTSNCGALASVVVVAVVALAAAAVPSGQPALGLYGEIADPGFAFGMGQRYYEWQDRPTKRAAGVLDGIRGQSSAQGLATCESSYPAGPPSRLLDRILRAEP